MMHAGACVRLNTTTLLLSEAQADELTRAGAEVAKHFDLPILDPKWQALIALGGVAAKIYGPMGLAYWNERRAGGSQPGQAPPSVMSGTGDAIPNGADPAAHAVMPIPFATGAIVGGNA